MQDLWAGHRTVLHDAISGLLDDARFTSGQLAREQIEATDPAAYETAALASLAAAEAVGGAAEAALPGAVAMAYVSQMGLVFRGLENSGGAASLSTAWGMPRSLNAGDAMFALAQESLLSMTDEVTAEVRLKAIATLDQGTRDLMETLFTTDNEGGYVANIQVALLPSAMAMGGLLGGGDDAACGRLEQLGREWSQLSVEDLTRNLSSDPAGWLER